MGIPTRFSQNFITLHCLISWNNILNNTSQYMSYMWLTVCSRRTVIKGKGLSTFSHFDTLFKYLVVFPVLQNFLFPINKVKVCRYFFIHFIYLRSFIIYKSVRNIKIPSSQKGREDINSHAVPPKLLQKTSLPQSL